MITGLGHVGIICDDFMKMRDFYTRVIGLTITDEDPERGSCFLSAAPAHEHAPLRLSADHGLADRLGGVGVVDGGRGMRAHVQHLVPLAAQRLGQLLLEVEARVVRPDDDPHFVRPSCCLAAAATFSGSKPNFFCSSLSGADAPKVFIPRIRPPEPT